MVHINQVPEVMQKNKFLKKDLFDIKSGAFGSSEQLKKNKSNKKN